MGTLVACGSTAGRGGVEVTFAGSALGREGEVLQAQVARFMASHPGIHVRILPTPDDASQRHQLFVQWLNAHVGDPDVLQLDVVWTAEFAAAGWIAPLEAGDTAFFPATLAANRWNGRLYALPWFVDVGMLYWRTDLLPRPPATLDELVADARAAMSAPGGPPDGIVWQGARYEGLVTVFLEYLGAFGGRIVDDAGRVQVDAPAGVRALTFMRDEIGTVAPPEVLTWHEEETRFAFQNGQAVFMRNWPYAWPLMNDTAQSRVAGRFAVTAMPGTPDGAPMATLGGASLAVNARSDVPGPARALAAFLTAPAQMLERARRTGQFPARPALFDDPALRAALAIPADQAVDVVRHARARPATPVYAQLSELLQVSLHRALAGQESPADALHAAARAMNALLRDARLEGDTLGRPETP